MVIGLTIQETHVWQKSSHKIRFYLYLLSSKYFPLKVISFFPASSSLPSLNYLHIYKHSITIFNSYGGYIWYKNTSNWLLIHISKLIRIASTSVKIPLK